MINHNFIHEFLEEKKSKYAIKRDIVKISST